MSKSTCWHYFKKFYCVDKYLNSSYTSHCDPMLAQPSLYQYQHTHIYQRSKTSRPRPPPPFFQDLLLWPFRVYVAAQSLIGLCSNPSVQVRNLHFTLSQVLFPICRPAVLNTKHHKSLSVWRQHFHAPTRCSKSCSALWESKWCC